MSAGRPSREVAHRLFAVEFEDATVTRTESDDEMAPSYVVTPTGALVNRAFVVGTLTSVDQVGDDIFRGRVADPTGTFVTYAGQYQPVPANFLADATPPAIVALTGKARTFEPDGGDEVLSSLRPERIVETTPATRDHWVVETAEHTLGRIELMAKTRAADVPTAAVAETLESAGVPMHVALGVQRAIESYDPTPAYLSALFDRAVEALEVVAGDRDAVAPLDRSPGDGDGELAYADLANVGIIVDWLGDDVTIEHVPAAASTAGSTPAVDPEPDAPVPDESHEPSASAEATSTDDEPVTDELYELSDEEREAVEDEYGVDFATGDEIEPPTEDPDDPADAPEVADDPLEEEAVEPTESEPPADTEGSADNADEIDLETLVIEQMRELDDGDGADREALIDAVSTAADADAAAVGEAIQDALMSGSCYEPTEGRLKPI